LPDPRVRVGRVNPIGLKLDPTITLDKADALSKRNNYIKTKKSFNYSILKINKDESLLANKYELNATLRIFRDDKKEFLVKKGKLQISSNKIDECIKKHHDKLLQKHLRVIKIL